jgi:hypothetical protein
MQASTSSLPQRYALPICHAALGRTASASRGAGFQPACGHHRHRRQGLAVAASAQAGRLPHGLIQRLPPLLSSAFRS